MSHPYSIQQLDEPVYARRDLLAGSITRHPSRAPEGELLPMPAWSSLALQRRVWADGEALELRLDVDGEAASRCLATRDGQFLFGPTGPAWARDLAREAVQEWRAAASAPR